MLVNIENRINTDHQKGYSSFSCLQLLPWLSCFCSYASYQASLSSVDFSGDCSTTGRWCAAHLVQQVVYLDQSKYQLCLVAQPQCPLFLQEMVWQQKEAPLFEQQSHLTFILLVMAASMPLNSPLSSRQTSLHQRRHNRWPQYLPTRGPQSGPELLLSLPQRMLCLQKQHLTNSFSPLNGAFLGLLTYRYRLISSSSTDSTDPSESNSIGACFSLLFLLLSSPNTATLSCRDSTYLSTMSPTMNLQFLGWWMGIQTADLAQKLATMSWMLLRSAALYLQSWRIFLRILSQSKSSAASVCLLRWNQSGSSPWNVITMRRD